jgi:hypothetical protein
MMRGVHLRVTGKYPDLFFLGLKALSMAPFIAISLRVKRTGMPSIYEAAWQSWTYRA